MPYTSIGQGSAWAPTGPGQFDELQAAVERRAEEEAARRRQPPRELGQEKRRAGGTQRRYASAGRDARSGRAARSAGVPALSGGADGFDAARRGEAAGARSARAADRGHGASGLGVVRRGVVERRKPRFPRASPRRRSTGSASGRRRSISTSISSSPRIGSPKRWAVCSKPSRPSHSNWGYSLFSLTRAFSVVNCQSALAWRLFR